MVDQNQGQTDRGPARQAGAPSGTETAGAARAWVSSPATAEGAAGERDLWSGRGSARVFYGHWIGWLMLMGILLAAAWHLRGPARSQWPITAWLVAVVLTGGALLLRMAGFVLSRRYRITTQRLFVEEGILSKAVNQTDLIRVRDVGVKQSLFGRLFGFGDVRLDSPSDVSNPKTVLVAVESPQAVAEHIHNRMQAFRSSKATVMDGSIIDQPVSELGEHPS
jgi:membrane protein YdbS with pleckstrin-like domain